MLRNGSTTVFHLAQHCQTAGVQRPRGSRVNYKIMCDRSCTYVLITQKQEELIEGLEEELSSLFSDFCAGVNMECFIMKINQMLSCCFSI